MPVLWNSTAGRDELLPSVWQGYENGIYRDATPEEIAALEQEAAQHPTSEPTPEERITALEEELSATKILLGLEE